MIHFGKPVRWGSLIAYQSFVHSANYAVYVFWYGLYASQKGIPGYSSMFPWLALWAIFCFYMLGSYMFEPEDKAIHILSISGIQAAGMWVGTYIITSIVQPGAYPPLFLTAAGLLHMIFTSAYRILLGWLGKRRRQKKVILIVGQDETSVQPLLESALSQKWEFKEVQTCFQKQGEYEPEKMKAADEIWVSEGNPHLETWLYGAACNGKSILIMPAVSDVLLFKPKTAQLGDRLMYAAEYSARSVWFRFSKRTIDITFSLVGICLLSPVLLILYIWIPLNSKGKSVFKQERVGKNGNVFHIYKFRTMVDHAEKDTGPVLAELADPRITSLGRWMRATRLDEIPQLFNVLKGDMSLVGPRPERPFFVEQFQSKVPAYQLRHSVKPGLTGLAQINGSYATKPEEKHYFDLLYLRTASFLLDVRILVQTLFVIMNREQAKGVKQPHQLKRVDQKVRHTG
ncbi:sugar transferase [Paenibacillus larvae]